MLLESVDGLKTTSKTKILVRCDNCETENRVQYRSIYMSRTRRKSEKDFCIKCARNFAAINRRRGTVHDSNGYSYVQDGNERVFIHTKVAEEKLGRPLTQTEVVHHINGDKKDNSIENLYVFENQKQHMLSHNSLEELSFYLVKNNYIKFDTNSARYYLNKSNLNFEKSYGFENIAIKQKKNICKSRLDTSIKSEFVRGLSIDIPLIAANMSTVINSDFYIELYKLGAIGILHRAQSIDFLINEVNVINKKCHIVAASIGVGSSSLEDAKSLIQNNCNVLCIDIAHGYSNETIDLAKKIKQYSKHTKIILGNSVNTDILSETNDFVDAIKVGIAQGFACETKNTAGCTEKQFSAVLKFKDLANKLGMPIISDGGIREPADFTKAIAAGASSVMAGKVFAECEESAGEIVSHNDSNKKLYAGMASSYVQESWKGGLKPGTCAEGGVRYLEISGSITDMIEKYSGALRSGITYSGANDIKSFHNNVEFIELI